MSTEVILLPGGVLPAGPAYAALIAELGPGVDARAKDLEIYSGDAPPDGYSLRRKSKASNASQKQRASSDSISWAILVAAPRP